MMDTEREQRLQLANAFIAVIAGTGRHFFAHEGHVSQFALDHRQRIWFVDAYTHRRIYTHYRGRWRGFTQGGTMRALVEALRDYIRDGAKPALGLGPWPSWICDGDLWAYGEDAMQEVRRVAAELWP